MQEGGREKVDISCREKLRSHIARGEEPGRRRERILHLALPIRTLFLAGTSHPKSSRRTPDARQS